MQHLANLARVGLEDSRGIGELPAVWCSSAAMRVRPAAIRSGGCAPIKAFGRFSNRRSYGRTCLRRGRRNEGRAIAAQLPPCRGKTIEAGESSPLSRSRPIDQIRTTTPDRARVEVVLTSSWATRPWRDPRGLVPVLIPTTSRKRCGPCW